MGQQQLILLVLATVIVGIAIVVGIAAFTENSAKANADAMMQDGVRMASDFQAWYKKPAPFGGRQADETWAAATLGKVGYGGSPYSNMNGNFTAAATANGVVITGWSCEPDAASCELTGALNQISVAVCGTTDEEIEGAIVKLNGATAGTVASCAASPAP